MKKLNVFLGRVKRGIFNKKNIKKLAKSYFTISLATRIAAFSIVMAAAPVVSTQAESTGYVSSIKFDKNNASALVIPVNKPEIKVGESKNDMEQRLALEAKQGSNRNVVTRERATTSVATPVDTDLSTKRALAQKAADQYGIDWKILEAVWQVESGKAWITAVKSYAGAQGPMQFMSGTWKKYAVDGNGDGKANINEAEDAVYAAASLLSQAGGYKGDYTSALLSYNHAMWYVNKVKAVANSIQ